MKAQTIMTYQQQAWNPDMPTRIMSDGTVDVCRLEAAENIILRLNASRIVLSRKADGLESENAKLKAENEKMKKKT